MKDEYDVGVGRSCKDEDLLKKKYCRIIVFRLFFSTESEQGFKAELKEDEEYIELGRIMQRCISTSA